MSSGFDVPKNKGSCTKVSNKVGDLSQFFFPADMEEKQRYILNRWERMQRNTSL